MILFFPSQRNCHGKMRRHRVLPSSSLCFIGPVGIHSHYIKTLKKSIRCRSEEWSTEAELLSAELLLTVVTKLKSGL